MKAHVMPRSCRVTAASRSTVAKAATKQGRPPVVVQQERTLEDIDEHKQPCPVTVWSTRLLDSDMSKTLYQSASEARSQSMALQQQQKRNKQHDEEEAAQAQAGPSEEMEEEERVAAPDPVARDLAAEASYRAAHETEVTNYQQRKAQLLELQRTTVNEAQLLTETQPAEQDTAGTVANSAPDVTGKLSAHAQGAPQTPGPQAPHSKGQAAPAEARAGGPGKNGAAAEDGGQNSHLARLANLLQRHAEQQEKVLSAYQQQSNSQERDDSAIALHSALMKLMAEHSEGQERLLHSHAVARSELDAATAAESARAEARFEEQQVQLQAAHGVLDQQLDVLAKQLEMQETILEQQLMLQSYVEGVRQQAKREWDISRELREVEAIWTMRNMHLKVATEVDFEPWHSTEHYFLPSTPGHLSQCRAVVFENEFINKVACLEQGRSSYREMDATRWTWRSIASALLLCSDTAIVTLSWESTSRRDDRALWRVIDLLAPILSSMKSLQYVIIRGGSADAAGLQTVADEALHREAWQSEIVGERDGMPAVMLTPLAQAIH